jgi:hypothetical protein
MAGACLATISTQNMASIIASIMASNMASIMAPTQGTIPQTECAAQHFLRKYEFIGVVA